MRPVRLELRGFLSYRDPQEIEFGSGALAVLGDNGAGKTSLIEALGWCLYGKGRARSMDDFVAAEADEASVTLEFALGEQSYRCRRERKREGSSYLGLAAQADGTHPGDPAGSWVPVGGDSIAETQAAIEDLLGMSWSTWEATSFIGQGRADAFTSLPPSARKELLAEVLELGRWAELEEAAKLRASECANEVIGLQRQQLEVEELAARAEPARADWERQYNAVMDAQDSEQVAELRLREARDLAEEARRRAEEQRALVSRLRALEAEHAAAFEIAHTKRLNREGQRESLESVRLHASSLPERSAALEDAIGRRRALEAEIARLEARIERAQAASVRASADATRLKDEALQRQLRVKVLSAEQTSCPLCGTPLDPESRARLIESEHESAGLLALAASDAEFKLEEAFHEIAEPARSLGEARKALPDLAQEIARLEQAVEGAQGASEALPGALRRAEAAEEAYEAASERLRAAGEELATIREEVSESRALQPEPEDGVAAREQQLRAAQERLAQERRALGAAEARLEAAEAARGRLDQLKEQERAGQAEHECWALLRRAYGRDGIPALVIEVAVPALEEEANRLLEQLTDGRWSCRIESLRALKGGGLRESLEVIVGDAVSERPLEALSGGERQCVDLALRIGLARMLAARARQPIETLVIDEGFTALDAAHRQRTISVLGGLLSEFRSLLFVTHLRELADAFPERLLIQQEAGSSIARREA